MESRDQAVVSNRIPHWLKMFCAYKISGHTLRFDFQRSVFCIQKCGSLKAAMTLTFCLRLPKSIQFILESECISVQSKNKMPQRFLEIKHSQKWPGWTY